MEMFGVVVDGTPNPSRLFLPDDWPDGVYPLRKDAVLERLIRRAKPGSGAYPSEPSADTVRAKFVVPIGPQHPALKEPGHFEFTVDGEIVTDAAIRLGYVHRGIEKACEERNWIQNLYLFERICGICSHTHAFAYSLGVEKLAGVEAPPRAQAIRELVAGLERIHSHLLWVGVAAHEAGFDTLFMYSWRDRETVMDLLEAFTGNRVNYSVNVLGGVKYDVDEPTDREDPRRARFPRRAAFITTWMWSPPMRPSCSARAAWAIMTAEEVERLGVVGPTARASGVVRDIRVEAPYGSYVTFPGQHRAAKPPATWKPSSWCASKSCWSAARPSWQSWITCPTGELTVRMPRKIPAGETISRVEAPRGELFYFIKSNGGEKPERIKVRTPSICNFASVAFLVVGHQLADVPMILAGIDPCFSCNDRAVVLRTTQRRAAALCRGKRCSAFERKAVAMSTLPSLAALLIFPSGLFILVCWAWLTNGSTAKLVARLQNRIGPRWFQPLADVVKLLSKEEVVPTGVDRVLFVGLPIVALAGALTAALYVPILGLKPGVQLPRRPDRHHLPAQPADPVHRPGGANTGGRFSMIGATRTLTQVFSYEAPFLLAMLGPAIVAGSWQISEINYYASTALAAADPAARLRRCARSV